MDMRFLVLILLVACVETPEQNDRFIDSTTYVEYLPPNHFRTYGWKNGRIIMWGMSVLDTVVFYDDYSLYRKIAEGNQWKTMRRKQSQ